MIPLNGPWHCGFPMHAQGGNQASAEKWLAFRCSECGHAETMWGTLKHDATTKSETWIPAARKLLTILMSNTPEGVLVHGICEDRDIFGHLLYATADMAVKSLGKHYSIRGYRLVFNLPKEERRDSGAADT